MSTGVWEVQIDINIGLDNTKGKVSLYRKLLGMFLDSQQSKETQLDTAMDGLDFGVIESIAHSLKGTSGTIGATRVQQAADSLEMACKESIGVEEIKSLNAKLILELGLVIDGLHKFMDE